MDDQNGETIFSFCPAASELTQNKQKNKFPHYNITRDETKIEFV